MYRIPLPLPGDALGAVNVYAIEDGRDLVLIDSGAPTSESRATLRRAVASLGCGLHDVSRFLVTHVHYDHYSLAVRLRREIGSRVSLGSGEQLTLEELCSAEYAPFSAQFELLQLYGAADLAPTVLREWEASDGWVSEVGMPDEWIHANEEFLLADRTLTAIHTPGHTRGHMVFDDVTEGLLFAGDHVLTRITPSIGFEAAPASHALGDYLRSLARVRERADRRLLPAHGPTGESVHARVDELLEHHEQRLSVIWQSVEAGERTAACVAATLSWTRRNRCLAELDAFNGMLAVLETGAHLDFLVAQGALSVTIRAGVRHYLPA